MLEASGKTLVAVEVAKYLYLDIVGEKRVFQTLSNFNRVEALLKLEVYQVPAVVQIPAVLQRWNRHPLNLFGKWKD